MTLKIQFETDNAAFDGDNHATETALILHDIAEDIASGATMGTVRDANGNRIGTYKLAE